MRPGLLRRIYNAVSRASRPLHVPVKTLWSFGFVSDTSILLDDSLMQRRWEHAESSRLSACHSAPIVLLGESGSGKTSLSRTLRNLPPSSETDQKEDDDTSKRPVGVEETHAEVSYVDMSWADWGRRLFNDFSISEHVNAMLYFVAAEIIKRKRNLGKIDEKVRVKFSLYNASVCFVLISLFFFLPAYGLPVHFLFLLLLSCLLYSPVNRSHNLHFIIAYGSSISAVVLNFTMNQNYNGDKESAMTNLVAVLILPFLCTLVMGAGCGSGFALALSVCLPDVQDTQHVSRIILVFTTVAGHMARKQKGHRLPPSLQVSVLAILVAIAALTLYSKMMTIFYGTLGFLVGYEMSIGLECGHTVAPILSLGSRHITLAMTIGFVVGLPLAHFLQWRLIAIDTPLTLILSITAWLFILYMQYGYYRTVIESSRRTPLLQKLMDSSPDPRKPARFTLIDCSGDKRFRDIQHVYMSSFAIYIITFKATDIDEDNTRCDKTFNSLSQWLNTVAAHVERDKKRVYIVATHKHSPCASLRERRRRLRFLQRRLFAEYSYLLDEVPHRNMGVIEETRNPRIIFQVENTVREEGDEELKKLREAIMSNATTEKVFISWFHFLDVIREVMKKTQKSNVMPSFEELFEEVNMVCELYDKKEFKEMLQYFSDCGEIFFDSHQENTSPYVLLDRRILEKIVCHLVSTKLERQRYMITSNQLRYQINLMLPNVSFERVITFLVSLNFIIPVHKGLNEEQSYIIPFNLPLCDAPLNQVNDSSNQLCVAIFDFANFHPSPLFLQLLALCQKLQHCSNDAFPTLPTPKTAAIFRNVGDFTHGKIRYIISLRDHAPNKIWVHMYGTEPQPDAKTNASTLLHQINCLVQHLCANHFRSLGFTLQLVCECSMERANHDEDIHLHEYRMSATSTYPYTMPMRHHLSCTRMNRGMLFPWPKESTPSKLVLCSTRIVDFRFATDVCILSHQAPPASLLKTLRDLLETAAHRPVVLSYRSPEDGQTNCCDQFLMQKDHLGEASIVVILLHAGSDGCRACREKFRETWEQKRSKEKVRVIPILMDSQVPVPSFFNFLMCLYYEEDEETFRDTLERTIVQGCHFNN